jgi:hypothetical protein
MESLTHWPKFRCYNEYLMPQLVAFTSSCIIHGFKVHIIPLFPLFLKSIFSCSMSDFLKSNILLTFPIILITTSFMLFQGLEDQIMALNDSTLLLLFVDNITILL